MTLLNQMHAAWQAEIAKTHDKPKDMILTNWHLGAADGWYRAMEMVRAAIGPEPERSGHYECLSDKPGGSWDEAFKPKATREAVTRVVTESGYTNCPHDRGDCCAPDKCPCDQTIDAIMTLIGDAP